MGRFKMTPTQQYYQDGDYSKLSEDEINGIIAELEGNETEFVKITDDGRRVVYKYDSDKYDYLHSWELTGPLIGKYEVDIAQHSCSVDAICFWEDYRIEETEQVHGNDGLVQSRDEATRRAVVHAVVEIAREQKKEAAST